MEPSDPQLDPEQSARGGSPLQQSKYDQPILRSPGSEPAPELPTELDPTKSIPAPNPANGAEKSFPKKSANTAAGVVKDKAAAAATTAAGAATGPIGTAAAKVLNDTALGRAIRDKVIGKLLTAQKTQLQLGAAVLIAILCVLTGLLFGIFSLLNRQKGNPGTTVGVLPTGYIAGKYCANIMQPTLATTFKNKTYTLFLPGTTGGYSEESPIDPKTGHVLDNSLTGKGTLSKGTVTFWDYHQTNKVPDSWLPYYITSRWPYTGWYWGGTNSSKGLRNLPPSDAYEGKRVVIYNPTTNKAVLGIILEAGPAPYTGLTGSSLDSQKAAWGDQNRIFDPPGYTGNVAGGPYSYLGAGPSIESALGIKLGNGSNTPITLGFAPPYMQNADPGPVTCSEVVDALVPNTVPSSP